MPLPANYVTVAQRLTAAADRLQTVIAEPPVMLTDAMGYIRVTVSLSDGRSSTGTASFRLDLDGRSAQATNPIEDCETSAIGRALGILGYGSKDSIASQEDIHEAQRRSAARTNEPERNATAPTEKQRWLMGKRIEELGWQDAEIDAFTAQHRIDWDHLTKQRASEVIELLTDIQRGGKIEVPA